MSSVGSYIYVYHPEWIPGLKQQGWIPTFATAQNNKSTFVVLYHETLGEYQDEPPPPKVVLFTPTDSAYARFPSSAYAEVAYLSERLKAWTKEKVMVDGSLSAYQKRDLKKAQQQFRSKDSQEYFRHWFKTEYDECFSGLNSVGAVHYKFATLHMLNDLTELINPSVLTETSG